MQRAHISKHQPLLARSKTAPWHVAFGIHVHHVGACPHQQANRHHVAPPRRQAQRRPALDRVDGVDEDAGLAQQQLEHLCRQRSACKGE